MVDGGDEGQSASRSGLWEVEVLWYTAVTTTLSCPNWSSVCAQSAFPHLCFGDLEARLEHRRSQLGVPALLQYLQARFDLGAAAADERDVEGLA